MIIYEKATGYVLIIMYVILMIIQYYEITFKITFKKRDEGNPNFLIWFILLTVIICSFVLSILLIVNYDLWW